MNLNNVCVEFDSMGSFIDCPAINDNMYCLELSFKSELIGYSFIMNLNSYSKLYLGDNGNGETIGVYYNDGTNECLSYTTDFVSNEWNTLQINWNGSNYEFILDGNKLNMLSVNSHVPLLDTVDFYIGKEYDNGGYFLGKLDEIKVWSVQLDDSFLAKYRNRKLITDEEGLLLYYRCGDNGLHWWYDQKNVVFDGTVNLVDTFTQTDDIGELIDEGFVYRTSIDRFEKILEVSVDG